MEPTGEYYRILERAGEYWRHIYSTLLQIEESLKYTEETIEIKDHIYFLEHLFYGFVQKHWRLW